MSPPVAQQIITSMKIIMGEDGTDEGVPLKHLICMHFKAISSFDFIASPRRITDYLVYRHSIPRNTIKEYRVAQLANLKLFQ